MKKRRLFSTCLLVLSLLLSVSGCVKHTGGEPGDGGNNPAIGTDTQQEDTLGENELPRIPV